MPPGMVYTFCPDVGLYSIIGPRVKNFSCSASGLFQRPSSRYSRATSAADGDIVFRYASTTISTATTKPA